jgi:excisionase family DNA binding protein
MEKLLNKKEVAAIFGVTVKAIDKWMAQKKIPYYPLSRKCVRFRASDLEPYIQQHKEHADPDNTPDLPERTTLT